MPEVSVDFLTCWPVGHDYPLWRKQMARDRAVFDQVIIVFTDDNIPDLRHFLGPQLHFTTCMESRGQADWYDAALHKGLEASDAEWVWFGEQDFFYDVAFRDGVLDAAFGYDMIGSVEGERIEPSFCLIRREVIEMFDFGFQSGGGLDNFDAFSQAVSRGCRWTSPTKLGLHGWRHMRGLSHNHYLGHAGHKIEYKPDEFVAYLRECLDCGVTLDPTWRDEAESLIRYYA